MTSFMTLTPFGGIEAEVRLACISLFTAGGRVWDAESGGSSAQPRAVSLESLVVKGRASLETGPHQLWSRPQWLWSRSGPGGCFPLLGKIFF